MEKSAMMGLDPRVALERLAQDGPNELGVSQSRPLWVMIWDVVREPMFLLLIVAGILYFVMGDTHDALILLGFVEPVDFIHEQRGGLAMQAHALAGMIRRLAQVRHIAFHPTEIDKAASRALGNDLRQTRLPHAGWSVKNDRGKPVRLHRTSEQFPRPEDVLLPDVFVQRPWPHARRQRHHLLPARRRLRFRLIVDKHIVHAPS